MASPGKKIGAPKGAVKKPYQVNLLPETIAKIKAHCSLTQKTQTEMVDAAISDYLDTQVTRQNP